MEIEDGGGHKAAEGGEEEGSLEIEHHIGVEALFLGLSHVCVVLGHQVSDAEEDARGHHLRGQGSQVQLV